MRWIVVLGLSLFLTAAPAHALLIDSGVVVANQAFDLKPGFHLTGEGIDLSGFAVASQVEGPRTWRLEQFLDRPIDLSTTVLLRTATVTGALTFDVEPFTVSRDPVGVGLVHAQAPLTVHGVVQWDVFEAEVLGQGVLHYTGRYAGNIGTWDLAYTFGPEVAATPEPMSLLLVGTGLVAVGMWRLRR